MKFAFTAMLFAAITTNAGQAEDVELAAQLIRKIESNNGKYTKGDKNAQTGEFMAIGDYQLHKIMVDEVNRISKSKKYKYTDRTNPVKSKEMTKIFLNHQYQRYLKKSGSTPSVVMLATAFNKGDIFRDSNIGNKKYQAKIETEYRFKQMVATK